MPRALARTSMWVRSNLAQSSDKKGKDVAATLVFAERPHGRSSMNNVFYHVIESRH